MFICDCGRLFEKPKVYEEHHPYGMTYATEYFYECPYCGEGGFKKAEQCSRCGEYFAELEEEELCEVCYSEVYGEGEEI